MCETPRLSRPSINRNTHINHIPHISEQGVEVAVRHVEGEVADEEGARRVSGVGGAGCVGVIGSIAGTGVGAGGAGHGVLDCKPAAFEGLEIFVADGEFGGRLIGEGYVGKAVRGEERVISVRFWFCILRFEGSFAWSVGFPWGEKCGKFGWSLPFAQAPAIHYHLRALDGTAALELTPQIVFSYVEEEISDVYRGRGRSGWCRHPR